MDERTLNSIFFPKLSDAHIAQIEKVAQLKSYKDGEIIAEVGDRDICFLVIKSGQMAVVDRSSGAEKTVTFVEEKQFTGDVAHLTGVLSL